MIWVDITNLPHVLFFEDFIKTHEVLVTTREFGLLTELLDSKGIEYIVAGRHGGKNLREKLIRSSERVAKLSQIISREDIDVAISKHSPELPRVAFGLGIPCIQIVDNEHAEHQNRLFLALCSKIVIPEALDYKKLLRQGAIVEQIERFRGLCESAHIKNFEPKGPRLEDYILVRPEPRLAAYFNKKTQTQEIDRVKDLGYKLVVMPRGREKYENAILLKDDSLDYDSLTLIYHAEAFLGGGGTMGREGALLGTPSISYYPQDLLGVDRFLIKEGLLHHTTKVSKIPRLVTELIEKKQKLRERAENLVRRLEDPFKSIEREINNLRAKSS